MKAPLSKVPALPVVTGLVAGIFVTVSLGSPWWALIPLFLLAAALFVFHRPYPASFLAFAGVGMALAFMRMPQPPPPSLTGVTASLTGRIVKVVETDITTRYIVDFSSFSVPEGNAVPCRFKASATVFSVENILSPGDIVAVTGRVLPLDRAVDVPYETDYSSFLFLDGVTARMQLRPEQIRLVASDPSWLQRLAAGGASFQRHAIASAGFDGPATAFLLAVFAGDDLFLSPDLEDSFRASGLAHLLALSGLHVGIVVALASMLLFLFRALPGGRWIYYLGIAAVVLLYALVTGLSPSVARAAVMVVVFVVARLLQRQPSPANALCVTVALWLMINPLWLYSPGLQLSVAAVISILWLGNLFNPVGHDRPRLRFVVNLFVIPVAAVIGTSMIAVCYFHSFPLWFLPSNIVASLLMPLIVGAGIVCVLLSAVGLRLIMLARLVDFLYSLLDGVVGFFASLPGAEITGIYAEWWQTAVYLLAIGFLVVATVRRRAVWFASAVVALAVLVAGFVLKPVPDGSEMYVPRVSSSTDILIRHGSTAMLVTDGDTTALSAASARYAGFLARRGCRSLTLAPAVFSLGPFSRQGRWLFFSDRSMMVVTSGVEFSAPPFRPDYVLVGKGFTADIRRLAAILSPDTVILANSLNVRRRRRYENELREMGQPVLSLDSVGFSFVR